MNTTEFHQVVEQTWQKIEETLEEQECDVDCETQGAVFTLYFSDDSQIVINKQEPLLELWLASKLGGYHFKYIDGQWINAKGEHFWQHLEQACTAHGEDITFNC